MFVEDLEWISLWLVPDLVEEEEKVTNLVTTKAEDGTFRHLKKKVRS